LNYLTDGLPKPMSSHPFEKHIAAYDPSLFLRFYAQTKEGGSSSTPGPPDLGKFWRVLQWKMLVYFMCIWPILWLLEIFYGHLVHFAVIWYIFPRFGMLYQEKSGNPAAHPLFVSLLGNLFSSPFFKQCYYFAKWMEH
jgi:hypothetical protein